MKKSYSGGRRAWGGEGSASRHRPFLPEPRRPGSRVGPRTPRARLGAWRVRARPVDAASTEAGPRAPQGFAPLDGLGVPLAEFPGPAVGVLLLRVCVCVCLRVPLCVRVSVCVSCVCIGAEWMISLGSAPSLAVRATAPLS